MKTRMQKIKTPPAAEPSGNTKRKKVKVDWAFRRLRHQAIAFLSRGDRALRRELTPVLNEPRTWSEMEKTVVANLGPRKGPSVWREFMDQFFGHQINRSA